MKIDPYIKCTLLLCIFFIYSCFEPQQASNTETTAHNAELPSTEVKLVPTPLLNLNELLNASDVKASLASAAKNKDVEVLKQWQSILLQAAEEVDLLAEERQLLEGEQGLIFLEFQGMKTNYQYAFESAFYGFEDVDAVYAAFPAFKDLHARSKQLVIQRDKLVNSVAIELASEGFEGDALAEARRQWLNFVRSQED